MVGKKNGFFDIFVNVVMIALVIVCLFPFLIMIISSFTAEESLIANGYSIFPSKFGLDAYTYLLKRPITVVRAYGVTVIVTVVGTLIGLIISTMLAYGLSIKKLPFRNAIAFFLFFTMLFNGGTVPSYMIWTQFFHIKNTLAGLILPRLLVFAFYVIVTRTYFQSNIPEEIKEAARIDGANEFKTFLKVVLPMSVPIICSIGLMIGISYWNDWINGLYYVSDTKLYSIQQLLNRMLADVRFLTTNTVGVDSLGITGVVPNNGLKMAIATIGALPIMVLLPFFQKYYVKGLTLGAVKG